LRGCAGFDGFIGIPKNEKTTLSCCRVFLAVGNESGTAIVATATACKYAALELHEQRHAKNTKVGTPAPHGMEAVFALERDAKRAELKG
jgi:hypothetical protein